MSEQSNPKIPTGRPPGSHGVRALAARSAHSCIRVLTSVANNEQATEADRVRAAEVILHYAVSQPKDAA